MRPAAIALPLDVQRQHSSTPLDLWRGHRARSQIRRIRKAASIVRCERQGREERSKKAQVPFDDEDDQDTHMSVSGGYDPENDDFDYDEFVEKEFGKGRRQNDRFGLRLACS